MIAPCGCEVAERRDVIDRDRWGRPFILQEAPAGKRVGYTRATTLAGTLADTFALGKWRIRMVLQGVAETPELLPITADATTLNRVADTAFDLAGGNDKAAEGTLVHALCEAHDEGAAPVMCSIHAAMIAAYAAATANLEVLCSECFVVWDEFEVAGTLDRLVKLPDGRMMIADIKTGSIELGIGEIEAQLAIYANGKFYDPATGKREAFRCDLDEAIIIHLPRVDDPAEARCELWTINIKSGRVAVGLAYAVRANRKIKFKDRAKKLDVSLKPAAIRTKIAAAQSPDEVRGLWAANKKAWSDALTKTATKRVAELEEKEQSK